MVSLSDIVQVILSLSDFDGAVLRLAIKIRGNDRPSCEDCAKGGSQKIKMEIYNGICH